MKDRIKNSSIWHAAGDLTKRVAWKMTVAVVMLSCLGSISLHAQQTQIPTLQVCNLSPDGGVSYVVGDEFFKVSERASPPYGGSFHVNIEVWCDPQSGYPAGSVTIDKLSMNDSVVVTGITSTTIDQVTFAGTATPTAWLSGRCTVAPGPPGTPPTGCRYWMLLANNNNPDGNPNSAPITPDVVSFLVFDNTGKRIAYGTAPGVSVETRFLWISPIP
jgi:hypothetical protein